MLERIINASSSEGGIVLDPFCGCGTATDAASAAALAEQDRYQFEWWALGLVDARPAKDRRRGADGYSDFCGDNSGRPRRIIVQVKSGHVNRGMIATLKGDMEREKAEIGAFITLQPPPEPTRQEALSAGIYTLERFPDQQYPPAYRSSQSTNSSMGKTSRIRAAAHRPPSGKRPAAAGAKGGRAAWCEGPADISASRRTRASPPRIAGSKGDATYSNPTNRLGPS